MDRPRRLPVVARSAFVVGVGLWAALAAARPAAAQFDMDPYRPYNGQYRSSNFPAELGSSGDAILGPATTSFVPGVSRYQDSYIGDRLGSDLDRDIFQDLDPRGDQRGATPRYRNPADKQVSQDRTLRDRYYLEAMRETNPRKRAELLELYRREDRRLTRALSARATAPPEREPAPRSPAPAGREAGSRTPAAPARREAAPRTPAPGPRTAPRTAPAGAAPPAPGAAPPAAR